MRVGFCGIAVLAGLIAWGAPAIAHHSNPLYFDMTKPMTLEGKIVRVEWINPHALLFLESKSDNGEPETWILQGASLGNVARRPGLKERLLVGVSIAARVYPPRNPLYVNDVQAVMLTKSEDARKSSRIVGAGQVRLANGDLLSFGGEPTF
jgi:hypothetical protein